MWNLLIGGVVNLATAHLKNKAEEKAAVHQRKITQIANDASWDERQADASANSLRDEWFIALLSIPLIGAFIPDARPYIENGFLCLEEMPDMYKAWLSAAIAASFGLKSLNHWRKK